MKPHSEEKDIRYLMSLIRAQFDPAAARPEPAGDETKEKKPEVREKPECAGGAPRNAAAHPVLKSGQHSPPAPTPVAGGPEQHGKTRHQKRPPPGAVRMTRERPFRSGDSGPAPLLRKFHIGR